MADTDDWGGIPVQAQPKSDDWGGVPVAQPKIPDMSGAQKMAADNLAANDNKSVQGGGEPKPPQTPQERLDTATGMPIQSVINGTAKPSDVPQTVREDYNSHVKAGTVDNFGSYVQLMLHTTVPIAAGIIRAGDAMENTMQQTSERYVGAMAYPFLSAGNQQKLEKLGIVPPPGGTPINPDAPMAVKALHGFAEGVGGTLGTAISAPYLGVSVLAAPITNPIMKAAAEVAPSKYASVIPDILNLGMTLGGAAGIHHITTAAPQFSAGAGPWDNHPGSEVIKDAVAKKLGKEPAGVTSQDVDQVLADGSKTMAPHGDDYQVVATAMGVHPDIIQDIHNKTGVFPDQIFKDAQSVPAIAEDVGAGRIPAAYSHLIEKPQDVLTPENAEATLHPKPQENIYSGIDEKVASMSDEEKSLRLSMLNQKMREAIITPKEMLERDALLPTKELPPDIAEAMARMDTLSKESSSIDLSKDGASSTGLLSSVAKIFNPTGQSETAGDMATALRQGRGPVAQYVSQIQDGLSGFAKTVSSMSDDARLKFIDYVENRGGGAKLDDASLQPLADKIRDVYATMAEKIGKLFPDVRMRQDYFTHQYTDEAAAAKFFSDWAAKQGSERNLQGRVFPTLQEAIAAGLEPRTTNPIDTVMSYVTNIGKLESAHRSLNLARKAGIAEYFAEGQQPEGWVPLGGKLSSEGGKLLYAPEDAARIYNNDISKGFTGPIGEVVDAVGRVNNFNNMLMLSLSAYHATVTTLSSMSKDVGRALTQGTLADRASSILSAVTPLKNTLQGGKLIDAYLGREELSPAMQKTMDTLVKNNAINIKQPEYWKAGPAKNYVDVFQHGSVAEEIGHAKEAIKEAPITGTAKVIANEAGRVMNTISAPLFEHYIPRIKLAASFNGMHAWMKEHPDATTEQVDKAAQDIGNSADNAFGEMNRDNLFWHNITRQTLQTAFLSYSWITGAARMLQGIPDIGKTLMGKQELTSNARYLMGMAATYATINGVRTYLGTGHAPDRILDFIYPLTGGATPEGQEERALLPSHIGQYTQYLMHGINELGNEASPTLKLLYHLLSNSDFRGLPITNENNQWYTEQRWDDYAHYVLGEETPIGLKTFITGKVKGSNLTPAERALGVRQAPREITDPEGQKTMMQKIHDSVWKKKLHSDAKQKAKYESDDEN